MLSRRTLANIRIAASMVPSMTDNELSVRIVYQFARIVAYGASIGFCIGVLMAGYILTRNVQ